jgi:hypothetical protein
VLEVLTDSVPTFMNVPAVDYHANHINPTWIKLTWQPIMESDMGRDSVIYYNLEWYKTEI